MDDLLYGNVDVDAELDIIDRLTELTTICFRYARSGLIPKDERKEFSERAENLTNVTQILAKKKFASLSQDFLDSKKKLETVSLDVKKKIKELETAVETLKTINQILQIVDQGLAIAAGLAKM